MKSMLKSVSVLLVLTLIFYASSNLIAQNRVVREISSFDQVKISDDIKVVFKKSDKEIVTIVANGIGYDKIVTESSGRELIIKLKTGIYSNIDVQIEVEYTKLRSIDAGNKADVRIQEVITGDELNLKATGGAVIHVEVDVSAVKASLSNGGRIEISGKAELQEVDASMAAKYHAYEFETVNGYVKSNTNSDVIVWVKNKLEASAGSKAELKYRGKPAEVVSNTSLGGTITGDI